MIERPKPPIGKIIYEGDIFKKCKSCGSSLLRWPSKILGLFGIGKVKGCINPECLNYYVKK